MKRLLLKFLTYRAISVVVTGIVSFSVTGNLAVAAAVGSIDAVAKLFVYAAHEAAWSGGVK